MKISKTGYKKNSKDKNESSLLIPSNRITMKGVEFPVLGTDNTGYSQMMYPGMDYTFPGSYVYELPMAKEGGYILPGKYKNPEGNWLNKYQSKTATGSVKNNTGPRISNMPTSIIDGKIEIAYDGQYVYVKKPSEDAWNTLSPEKSKAFLQKYSAYIPQTLSQKEESDKAFKAKLDAQKRKDDAHRAALQKSADDHKAAELQRAKELTRQARIVAQQKAQEKGWFDSAWNDAKGAYESLPDVPDVINSIKGAYESLPDVEDVSRLINLPADAIKLAGSYAWNYKIPETDIPGLRNFGELSLKDIYDSFYNRVIEKNFGEDTPRGESNMEEINLISEDDVTSGTSDMQQLNKSRAKYGPQRLPARKDSRGNMLPSYQSIGGNDSLARFTYTFNNDILGADTLPPTHFVTPKIKELTGNTSRPRQWNNAFAVGDFLRDADITENQFYHPDKYYVGSGSTLRNSDLGIRSNKLISASNQLNKDPEKYWTVYKWDPKNPGAAWVRYMKTKEINAKKDELLKKGWNLDMPTSLQHKFDDVDWDRKGSSTGYKAPSAWVPLKKDASNIKSQEGQTHTYIPQGLLKGQDNTSYNLFSGGSITFLWTDPETNERLASTIAGSVSDMKQVGEKLKRDYNLKDGELEFVYHDTGSYSAKPAAKNGTLYYDQWKNYNAYNKGYSGAALIVPTQSWLENWTPNKKEGGQLDKYQSNKTTGETGYFGGLKSNSTKNTTAYWLDPNNPTKWHPDFLKDTARMQTLSSLYPNMGYVLPTVEITDEKPQRFKDQEISPDTIKTTKQVDPDRYIFPIDRDYPEFSVSWSGKADDVKNVTDKDTLINLTNKPMGWFNFNVIPGQKYTDILGNNYVETNRDGTGRPEDYAKNWKTRMQDPNDTFRNDDSAKDAGSYYHSKDIPAFYGVENERIKIGKLEDFNENTVIVPVRNSTTPYSKVGIEKGIFRDNLYTYDKEGNKLFNISARAKFLVHSPETKNTIFLSRQRGSDFAKSALEEFSKNNPGAYMILLDEGRFGPHINSPEGLDDKDFERWNALSGTIISNYLEELGKPVTGGFQLGSPIYSPVGNKRFGYNLGILKQKTGGTKYQTGGPYNPFQYAVTDPERMRTMLQLPGQYVAPTVDIVDKSQFVPMSVPGVHGSVKTVYVNPKTKDKYETPQTTKAQLASSDIARSNNVDPIGMGILAASTGAPLIRTAGRTLAAAQPYLNAPL
ncbi:MAG: hypothetical protein EBU90_08200, partial [Proteobacteria bacterium]|nr:hypothetical protein [Pseudomonadota bacterium]